MIISIFPNKNFYDIFEIIIRVLVPSTYQKLGYRLISKKIKTTPNIYLKINDIIN